MNETLLLEIQRLSDDDLKKNLITLDFRGKEFKDFCLQEFARRMENKWWEENKYRLESV